MYKDIERALRRSRIVFQSYLEAIRTASTTFHDQVIDVGAGGVMLFSDYIHELANAESRRILRGEVRTTLRPRMIERMLEDSGRRHPLVKEVIKEKAWQRPWPQLLRIETAWRNFKKAHPNYLSR